MKTIQMRTLVGADRKLTVQLPAEIPPGMLQVVLVIEPEQEVPHTAPLALPVHDVGPWPDNLSLRREDMYGDDGR